jgi:oligopeptide transport system ATP-binding protein
MAVIWITHDLGIIAGLAERVVVMYAGYIVEHAAVRELYGNPRHPYTIGLLGALPRVDGRHGRRLTNIVGRPPDLLQEPTYCPFAPRCPYADRGWQENPQLRQVAPDHQIACWENVTKAGVLKEEVAARG